MRVCVKTISPIDMMCPPTSAVAPSLGESFHLSEVNCSCFQRGKEVNSLQSLHVRTPVSSISVLPRLYNPDTGLGQYQHPFPDQGT